MWLVATDVLKRERQDFILTGDDAKTDILFFGTSFSME